MTGLGSTSSTDLVRVDVRGRVGHITINRPEVRNAINLEVSTRVAGAVDDFVGDDQISVIVLAATGSTFSAGMDLKAFLAGERPSIPGRGLCGITETGVSKPLIAAVEGAALAGGFEVALAADIIVASSTASFSLPEVKRGLVAAGGGLLRLGKVLPYGTATEFALTGRAMGAQEAHKVGLVTLLVDEGEAIHCAVDLAQKIAANGPLAVAASKRILAESLGWVDPDQYAWMRSITQHVFESEDATEGARAFTEKRTPQWEGR